MVLGKRSIFLLGALLCGSSVVGVVWATADAAKAPLSQDPRTWVVDGKLRPDLIPERVAMDSDLVPSGIVYVDPREFYVSLGANPNDETVPIFDLPSGGTAIGTLSLASGIAVAIGSPSPAPVVVTVATVADGG